MSKQDIATARWETAQRMAKINRLMAEVKDYSFPAGQVQADYSWPRSRCRGS